jgi:FkbM family methyltransferase
MAIKHKVNTLLKKSFQRTFRLVGIEILTSSDHSNNGLLPIVQEFFLRQSRGILHIGAHEGQEAVMYDWLSKPVIYCEAIPLYFERLQKKIKPFRNQVALNALLDSECRSSRDFFITSNNGESSSIYPLAGNEYWHGLENSEVCKLPSKRLDCIFSDLEMREFDYWIVDVQGAEIEVLKGAGSLLIHCKWLQVEISQGKFYEGGAEFQEVKDFLKLKGFVPMWLPSQPHEEIIFMNTSSLNVARAL